MRLIVMMGSRRLATTLAAMAIPVALAAGCASATSTSTSLVHPAATAEPRAEPTASFSAMGLSFRYRASWHLLTPQAGLSDFPDLIVYLSTSRLTGTCVARTGPGRIAETCAYPLRVLPPGGVLVGWSAQRLPIGDMPQANTTVGGRGAVETRTRGGSCATLGATETITVMVPRAAAGSWYQMGACLRAPGLPQQEAEISAMLDSVRISPGS
jgi:hypothetical protein